MDWTGDSIGLFHFSVYCDLLPNLVSELVLLSGIAVAVRFVRILHALHYPNDAREQLW